MRHYFFVAGAFSVLALFSASGPVHAQHRGGPYRGGPYHGGPYHGGYWRGGVYIGLYGPGYYPYWYGGVAVPLAAYPYYDAPPATVYVQPAPEVATPAPPSGAPANNASPASPAKIRVILSDPQATVLIDGRVTTGSGTERNYHTPPLAPGGSYNYRVQAIWSQGGRQVASERVIPVAPGQTSVLDFSQAAPEQGPGPGKYAP